jgi:hypothetical protein
MKSFGLFSGCDIKKDTDFKKNITDWQVPEGHG